ncbi:polyhydroxyalkanoate synthesis repressor PhaR [Thioclava sp. SK-1]|uniref:polyhydroxyalkanoate synthesis repressor PhaR n=1 Tax=Thioclava sp. SK-1 TaxID=1889770 RepID=UPI000826532F|nr:polyhydroxyalkanoate synthesis repressor PhaR [Thioclava sp. SK-1]OCX64643.1 polyhydroxyalkanoate synthesis repressor PhaR [Thioclava sp. SK-1]
MTDAQKTLLIKRYASRRLYNTETSDYVTLEDIARFIRSGREVKIVDLKTGDELTRQYLLQIIAEHESRGENMLPVSVLTDLVRSYTTSAQAMMPQFLTNTFEMLRQGQEQMMGNLNQMPNPMAKVPGFDALHKQQQAFLESMMSGWPKGGTSPAADSSDAASDKEDLQAIKKQLAELQSKLSKL